MIREEAILWLNEELRTWENECQSKHPIKEALYVACRALEQEPRWIPVTERLPEDSGEYLVSVIDREDEGYKQVGVAWFAHPTDYNIKDGEWRELMIDEEVTAWMPLPEPYKGGGKNEYKANLPYS